MITASADLQSGRGMDLSRAFPVTDLRCVQYSLIYRVGEERI